ncbi:hypothetical protein ANN_27946 [Periplaneta americana]|uniref:DUF4371 domain-containing protein n=1 Tax=Periplaneta americana TaxID=6978 RepID=A0ABQ8RVT0_PERAM|nr:hypothetical protein ANN_27946 [Periplaneta americana]
MIQTGLLRVRVFLTSRVLKKRIKYANNSNNSRSACKSYCGVPMGDQDKVGHHMLCDGSSLTFPIVNRVSKEEDFSEDAEATPHFPTQKELNDLIRDLGLIKSCAELLTSRLKVVEHSGLELQGIRTRGSDWQLVIHSSWKSLKAVLLHNGNKCPSIPIAHSAHLKEDYSHVQQLLQMVNYAEQQWNVISDLKMIASLMGQQEYDPLLKAHLETSTAFKGMYNRIQNDLIEAVAKSLPEEIKLANHVAVLVDETTDVSNTAQFSIVLRYVHNGQTKERFIGFQDVSENRTAPEIAELIRQYVTEFDSNDKLFAQSYDGAASMAGRINGVQALIKQTHSQALFVHFIQSVRKPEQASQSSTRVCVRICVSIRRPEFECSGPQLEGPEFECSGPQLEGPEFEYSELSLKVCGSRYCELE